MQDQLKDFPVVIEIPVLWRDMDAFAHVNNAVYFQYFESARVEYLAKIGFGYVGIAPQIGPILKSASCTYRFPLTYPDVVVSATRTKSLAADRFVMENVVFSKRHNRIAAEGDGVVVGFNYTSNSKANLPEAVLNAIKNLEKRDFAA